MLCKIHSVAGGTGHEETGALVGSLAKGHPTVGRVRNTRKKMAFGGFGGFEQVGEELIEEEFQASFEESLVIEDFWCQV